MINSNKAKKKYNDRKVVRKSGIQRFSSDFNSRCLRGNCYGWKMQGNSFTETVADGSHSLHVKVTVRAPVRINRNVVRVTLVVGLKGPSERLACDWIPGRVTGQCDTSLTRKTVEEWHRGPLSRFKGDEDGEGRWNYGTATITENEASVFGWRQYGNWNLGEVKHAFV